MYVDLCMYVCSYVFLNADICVRISQDDDELGISQCVYLLQAEKTNQAPPKRSNAFRTQVASFFVLYMGHLKKLWLE